MVAAGAGGRHHWNGQPSTATARSLSGLAIRSISAMRSCATVKPRKTPASFQTTGKTPRVVVAVPPESVRLSFGCGRRTRPRPAHLPHAGEVEAIGLRGGGDGDAAAAFLPQ